MPTSAPSRREARVEQRHRQKVRRRRWWIIGTLTVLVLIIGCVAWVGVRGLQARSDLEAARSMVGELKSSVADLDMVRARKTFDEITVHTENARSLTSDPIWRTAEVVPWLGQNLTVVRELAEVTDTLFSDVGAPLIGVAEKIDPSSFAPKDGAIDITPLQEAVPVLVKANVGIEVALKAATKIDTSGAIAPVAEAKEKFVRLLGDVAKPIDQLADIVPLLPVALGADGPRKYVVMFQNLAEARALGGTALSFAVIDVDHGKISLQKSVAAGFSNFDMYSSSVVPIPEGAEAVYPDGAFGTFIPNATIRPSYTTAAETVDEMWKRQFGVEVDGVISMDPVALSYILKATGPISLSTGTELSSANLVSFLLNEVYIAYDTGSDSDNANQDAVYGEALDKTFAKLTGGGANPKVLISTLLKGWDERRLLYWSSHPDEEESLAKIGLNGELPKSDAKTERVGMYVQDNVGSKLNYYLKSAVKLEQAGCLPDHQNYRVSLDLQSTLDPAIAPGLSRFIVGQWEREGLQPGVQRMFVYLYAPPGSAISGASVNGEAIALEPLHDTDYPVGRVRISVNPGQTVTVAYDISVEGNKKKKLEAQVTPMVNPTTVTTVPLDCATVPQG